MHWEMIDDGRDFTITYKATTDTFSVMTKKFIIIWITWMSFVSWNGETTFEEK